MFLLPLQEDSFAFMKMFDFRFSTDIHVFVITDTEKIFRNYVCDANFVGAVTQEVTHGSS